MEAAHQPDNSFRCVKIGKKLASFDLPEWGCYEVVEYINIENVILAPDEPELQQGLQALNFFYAGMDEASTLDKAKVKTTIPFKGHYYVTKDRSDWVRVQIVQLDCSNQLAWVVFIDISLSSWHQVPFNRLLNLESRFWDLPPRILKCKLANVKLANATDDSQELLKEMKLLKAGDFVYAHVPPTEAVQNGNADQKIAVHLVQLTPNGSVNIQRGLMLYESVVEEKNAYIWGSPANALYGYMDLKLLTEKKTKTVSKQKKTFL